MKCVSPPDWQSVINVLGSVPWCQCQSRGEEEEEEVVSVDNISWLGQDRDPWLPPAADFLPPQLGPSWLWSNQSALARRHDDTDGTTAQSTATPQYHSTTATLTTTTVSITTITIITLTVKTSLSPCHLAATNTMAKFWRHWKPNNKEIDNFIQSTQ